MAPFLLQYRIDYLDAKHMLTPGSVGCTQTHLALFLKKHERPDSPLRTTSQRDYSHEVRCPICFPVERTLSRQKQNTRIPAIRGMYQGLRSNLSARKTAILQPDLPHNTMSKHGFYLFIIILFAGASLTSPNGGSQRTAHAPYLITQKQPNARHRHHHYPHIR